MRVLILAGGKATRLRPLTLTTPKAMTPLLGRPFLEHMLAWLAGHGLRDVTLLLGFLPDPIREHFGDGSAFGMKLSYLTEHEPLGSGGAIKQLEPELNGAFFALNGDVFTDLDLSAMTTAHRQAGAELSISLVEVGDPSAYGVVAREGEWITRFVEKPKREDAPSNLINAGVWLFEPSAVARIASGRFSMVEQELFPELASARRLYGFAAPCYWMDAGTPERYLQLHRDLLSGRVAPSIPLVQRSDGPGMMLKLPTGFPAEQDPPPEVDPHGGIDEPVVLGAGTRIGAGAWVRGPASIGARVMLQDGAEVADSVLWDGCRIGPGARVSGSVMASSCVVGQGAAVQDCVLGEGVQVLPKARITGVTAEPGMILR
jgi:NDP-sugar pyrophosphorylase family protein